MRYGYPQLEERMSASRLFSCRVCSLFVNLPDEEVCHCTDVPAPHPHGWGVYPFILFPSGTRVMALLCPECVEEYHITHAALEEQFKADGKHYVFVPVLMEGPLHDPSLN